MSSRSRVPEKTPPKGYRCSDHECRYKRYRKADILESAVSNVKRLACYQSSHACKVARPHYILYAVPFSTTFCECYHAISLCLVANHVGRYRPLEKVDRSERADEHGDTGRGNDHMWLYMHVSRVLASNRSSAHSWRNHSSPYSTHPLPSTLSYPSPHHAPAPRPQAPSFLASGPRLSALPLP